MDAARNTREPAPDAPWWRFRMMWLVVTGPLAVVVAGTVTAVVAVRGADVPVDRGAAVASEAPGADAQTPAVQARNHAATPRR